jgi:hypothetical protein
MQKSLLTIGLFLCLHVSAQLPEDALRASWVSPNGTARQQAIGGAMGSLGGEITAGFVNPGGLAFYKTNEIVVSPGWRFLRDKSNYQGANGSGPTAQNFNLGASGLVISYPGRNPGISNVFAVAVNRTANFNSNVYYKGDNDYSSFSEQFVEEYSASGFGPNINAAISSPTLSYGTRMALYTSLIDTTTVNGNLFVYGQPQKAGKLHQENNLQSTGGITEIDLSLATSLHNKWYIGGSLGIPILSYTRYQTYTESDATGNTNNDFESFTYREKYTSRGFGANLKFGAIYSPSAPWRIGLSIHTSSVLYTTDKISASMISKTENYSSLRQVSISSDSLDQLTGLSSSQPNSISYELYTPWHFLISGSWLFGSGQADTRRQKGFITADLEYITTHTPYYHVPRGDNNDGTTYGSDNSYYNDVNHAIKASYKNTLSARVGGEIKFNTLMLRAGLAYYTSPYKDHTLTADRLFLSGGIGYRNKGFFVDLTYVMGYTRNIDVPYRLADKLNTYASLKETGGTAMLTFGIKL